MVTDQESVKPERSRPIVTLFAWGIRDTLSRDMWAGFADAARENSAHSLCIIGRFFGMASDEEWGKSTGLYDLVGEENVDGLVFWSALVQLLDPEARRAIYARYRSLPMVNVGTVLEDIPSVVVNNYHGMRDAVLHLVQVHNRRRIAFVRGPEDDQEAQDRYQAYVDVLQEHTLDLDPDLVVLGDNQMPSGVAAVETLVDGRNLSPGAGFDAIVASNDNMAFGVLQALQSRDIQVPGDVAVVGFDDIVQVSPFVPLTTVRFPTYDLGRYAGETVSALLRGELAPMQMSQSAELIVRQSCGCFSEAVTRAAVNLSDEPGQALDAHLASNRERILAAMSGAVRTTETTGWDWAGQLLDQFVADIAQDRQDGGPGTFLLLLNTVLRQVILLGRDIGVWQGVISALRQGILPGLDAEMARRAEDLCQQARVMVAEIGQQARAYYAAQDEQREAVVRDIGQALIAVTDIADLTDVLARDLPHLGITSCYLVLYESALSGAILADPGLSGTTDGEMSSYSRLVLAYDDRGRVELGAEGYRFETGQLLPKEVLNQDACQTLVLQSLHFAQQELGFVFFGVDKPGELQETTAYYELRAQISGAVRSAMLNRERQRAEAELERYAATMERRAVQFRAASEVARDAAAIRELDELLDRTTNLVRDRFQYDYAGLFLVDDRGEYAVLMAGTGEAGREMLARRHRLKLGEKGTGEGLVGYVAASGEPHLAFDVGQDAVHFENPLLPDTRSEIALPLQAGGRIIGVLDVQSNHVSAFDEQDVAALRTVADQLAVTIENVRLFDEMQRAVQESAALSGEYTRQSWQDVARGSGQQGYRYRGLGVEPAPERSSEAVQALQSGQSVLASRQATAELEASNSVAVPVKLRDQVIGVLDLQFEGQSVSAETISLVEQVAERLALSLESARLLRTTQQNAAYQQLLGQVTTRIRETLDVETVLRTAADQVREVMGLPEVVIHLKNPADGNTGVVGE